MLMEYRWCVMILVLPAAEKRVISFVDPRLSFANAQGVVFVCLVSVIYVVSTIVKTLATPAWDCLFLRKEVYFLPLDILFTPTLEVIIVFTILLDRNFLVGFV